MFVISYRQQILPLLFVIFCIIGHVKSDANRRRRQATGDINRNDGSLSRNSDGLISAKNTQFNPNNQQQSNNNLLPSPQGQEQAVRSRSFYDSPAFKRPSFSGDKPTGWFDTKHQNWVSNQDGQFDNNNNVIDGKNAPPSSLQAKAILPGRDDGGAHFLRKVAKQYANRGEKMFSFNHLNVQQQQRSSICTNVQNFNGYTFGKFPCPLPPGTGMNQLDRFCCGIPNFQYCCNAQEFNQERSGGIGGNILNDNQIHSRHLHYSPRKNRTVATVVPIAGILVVVGALIIIVLYYKKLRNEQNINGKSTSATTRSTDNYSAVPQDPLAEKPAVIPRKEQKTTVQA